jgi:NADP-dependent 3-hydroxy acid dehydrogenase YdfG
MGSLKGKVAIVTGGSKGYGTGIAAKLAEAGASVWITGRNKEALAETSRRIGVRAQVADVTDPGDWDRLIKSVMGEEGRIDILVNNAGAGIRIAPLSEQNDRGIVDSIQVNLVGAMLGAKRVVPIMKDQGSGTIVNISSICCREMWPGFTVYSAAKAGMNAFGECLYTEVRGSGIRVTNIVPSWGATEFSASARLQDFDPETKAKVTKPEELGQVVVDVCSLPPHLGVLDLTVLPLVQEIVPL